MTAKSGESDERVDMNLTLVFVAILCTLLFRPNETPLRPEVQDHCNFATSPFRSSEVWKPEEMSHNGADMGRQLL
jgi:hypothetical protein